MLAVLLLTCSAVASALKPRPHPKELPGTVSVFKTFLRDWFDTATAEAGLGETVSQGGWTTGWIVLVSVSGVVFLAIVAWLGYKYSQWVSRNSRSKEGYRALAQAKAVTSSNAPSEVESPTAPSVQGGFFASIRGTTST